METCKVCGYPVGPFGCASCRIREYEGFPPDARCETCFGKDTVRCSQMGPRSVCAVWKRVDPQEGLFWKPAGGNDGVVKVRGKWYRFDCSSCLVTKGIGKERWQGPPTKEMEKAYDGLLTLRVHVPKGKH